MSKTILTVVKLEWGKGYYKNGALVHYHEDKCQWSLKKLSNFTKIVTRKKST